MSASETQNYTTTMTILASPEMANFSGKMHGGALLKFLDQVAYTCAVRYAKRYVVTVSVDNILFKQPIHIGELVTAKATVNHTGRTSMEIGVKLTSECTTTGEERHTHTCYFTMVAVDDQGSPTPVTPLEINNESQRRRWKKAKLRLALRKSMAEEMAKISAETQA